MIATFDGETPALVEHRLEEGAVFLFLSGWEPAESQLALSSKFVPLLFSIFEHTGFSIRSAATRYVGETNYETPGFFEVEENGGTTLRAVNLLPSEGVTEPFDPTSTFPDWGIPLLDTEVELARESLTETQLARLESVEKEENQKLWKWIVLLVLILLLIESWLAGNPRHRRPAKRDGTTPAPST